MRACVPAFFQSFQTNEPHHEKERVKLTKQPSFIAASCGQGIYFLPFLLGNWTSWENQKKWFSFTKNVLNVKSECISVYIIILQGDSGQPGSDGESGLRGVKVGLSNSLKI